jgi:surface polysaccharide O-acyltransferase-like enzyme
MRSREHYIDNLRNLAVLALILFHTARLFDREAWHMKDAHSYPAADWLVGFFNPWHMPLLFLLAGMSAVLALSARSAAGFIRERLSRLAVPFLAGIVLTVLPQVYLERISPYVPNRQSPIDFDGSFIAFVPRFFSMQPYPTGDFSWHHLWFIIYLLLYSIVLFPILWWCASSIPAERFGAWFAKGSRVLLLVLPIAAAELLLRPHFPSTNGLIDDWANHANYAGVLLLGALIAAAPPLAAACERLAWTAFLFSAFLMLGWLARGIWGPSLFGEGFRLWAPAVRALIEWLSIVALLGLARRHLARPIPYLTSFSRYALPFYIFHQLVIIWLGWLTFGWSSMPLAKYATIAIAALALSVGLARLFDLSPVTRFLLGLKTPVAGQAPRGTAVAGIV